MYFLCCWSVLIASLTDKLPDWRENWPEIEFQKPPIQRSIKILIKIPLIHLFQQQANYKTWMPRDDIDIFCAFKKKQQQKI